MVSTVATVVGVPVAGSTTLARSSRYPAPILPGERSAGARLSRFHSS
jgi:hypothetical protein